MVVHYGSSNIDGIKKEVQKIGNFDMVSELEKKIMDNLYKEYKNSGKLYCWKITEAYKELGVSEGDYVGVLNDSKYILLDDDCFKLTTTGIRYMDSYIQRTTINTAEEKKEIIKLSPEVYGVGINLKLLWHKVKNWFVKYKN